jgi:uncharacterized lipoprotein YehR (DUF1307 family)
MENNVKIDILTEMLGGFDRRISHIKGITERLNYHRQFANELIKLLDLQNVSLNACACGRRVCEHCGGVMIDVTCKDSAGEQWECRSCHRVKRI